MIKAVIFDMDDTLIKTRVAKYSAHKYFGKAQYNLTITDDDLDTHWGKPFPQMVQGLYQNVDTLENIISAYYKISVNFPISAYDGALDLLKLLKPSYKLGLVTAANTELMNSALEESSIDTGIFDYIQTSDDTYFHKPNPQVFLPALEFFGNHGIENQDIVYVGDAVSDLMAARLSGINFIGIANHTTPRSKFVEHHAQVADSFAELQKFLI